jgi:ParB family chromosome partitioning protein
VPKQLGLPENTKMRHDHHFVEQLAVREAEGIGQKISIDSLLPNPQQPRQNFERIDELVASIGEVGVLEPLLVRQGPQGFQIISGERRYRAAVEAGLDELPCMVLDVDDAQVLAISLIENLQRQDLSPFEEAAALLALVSRFDYTHEEVAQKIGKARTSVTEALSIADLPEDIKAKLEGAGVYTKSILLEVARREDRAEQAALVDRIVEEGLTRDQLRTLRHEAEALPIKPTKKRPGGSSAERRRLTYHSGTGITVTLHLNGDQITVPEIQSALREAIEELDNPPSS